MPTPMKKMPKMPMKKVIGTMVKKPLPSIYDNIAQTQKTLEQMQMQITKIATMIEADTQKDKKEKK